MVYMPQEDLLAKAEKNLYKLVTLASRRALELANGAPKLVDAPANEKLVTTALREIRDGKVVIKEYADRIAAEAKAEAKEAKKKA